MSNIDFLITDVMWLLSHVKITFLQGGETNLQKSIGSRTILGKCKFVFIQRPGGSFGAHYVKVD